MMSCNRKKIFIGFGIAVLIFIIWFIPWVPKLLTSSIEVTRLDAKGKPFKEEVGPSTKNWVEINKVSKNFLHAVIVSEDGKFYNHGGIDLGEMWASYKLNKRKGKYVRGGSTITQQVVKMTCLTREKTIIRKLREITGAILLELILSKEDILEWYVNLTEFGGGIYGIKPAGLHYFKTQPQLLTIEQSIALATVIPSPNKWSTGLRKKDLSDFGQRRFFSIASKMMRQGYLTKTQWENTLYSGNFGRPIKGYEKYIQVDTTVDEQIEDPADTITDLPEESAPSPSVLPAVTATPLPSQAPSTTPEPTPAEILE